MELGRFLYKYSERELQRKDCIKEHLNDIEVSSQVVRSGAPPQPKMQHETHAHCHGCRKERPVVAVPFTRDGGDWYWGFAALVKLPGIWYLEPKTP